MSLTFLPLVPKDPSGPLKVLVIGRISTPYQNIENLAASRRYVEDYLGRIYQGLPEITFLGEQASGLDADRDTIRKAEDLIASGQVDLVIAEDLARIHRNPRHLYCFIQDCEDAGVRVICPGDNFDSGDIENRDITLGAAALRHGLFIPDTRRRVRRTATHAFHGGGMVLKIRFGYRRLSKEEAAIARIGPTTLRIATRTECTQLSVK